MNARYTKAIIKIIPVGIIVLLLFLCLFSMIPRADCPVETRYTRGDQHSVNGLTAYKLATSQSVLSQSVTTSYSGSVTVYWGIKVWKRASDGTETEITTTYSAVVSRSSDGSGIQSKTWTCMTTELESTDAIVVRVYYWELLGSPVLKATFITEQLGANEISSTWTVYYYTYRTYNDKFDTTTQRFYWGTSTYNSRIENFVWSPAPPTGYTLLDSYSEEYQYASLGLWVVHPSSTSFPSSIGQSWNYSSGDSSYKLYQARFYLSRWSNPTGNLTAVLYIADGNGKPIGDALATSNKVDVTTVPLTVFMVVVFNFPEPRYTVTINTIYVIQCEMTEGSCDGSNYVKAGYDDYEGKDNSNMSKYVFSAWSAVNGDCCFYIYGETIVGYTLNLRVMDWDLTDAINGAYTYVNSSQQTSDANGWSNYTNLDSGTYYINVSWYGFYVNGTFSIELTTDTTMDVRCKIYDVYVQVLPANQKGILYTANVTVFNATSEASNKIRTNLSNKTGYTSLSNLPNATLTFTVYAKSDYSLVIANVTRTPTSDEQTLSAVICNQNYGTTLINWEIILIPVGIVFFSKSLKNKRKNKRRHGIRRA